MTPTHVHSIAMNNKSIEKQIGQQQKDKKRKKRKTIMTIPKMMMVRMA
jgi:hypothetical protein